MPPKPEKFTAATLTYNRIGTALKSIETVASDPLVSSVSVFDDGSEEKNLERLHQCFDSNNRVTIFENKKNKGYCSNLIKALHFLTQADTEYAFLCESDMLLAQNWGRMAAEAFYHSTKSVALGAMLHRNQLTRNRSAEFKRRCIEGEMQTLANGEKEWVKKPFGSCYISFPDQQTSIPLGRQKVRYVSNSVGTLIFRTAFLKKLIPFFEQLREYPEQEDAWLSWACFAYNDFNPKSLMALDPGLAFTFGDEGLHGLMILNNHRWIGSFWWRYRWSSTIIHYILRIKYGIKTFFNP